MSGKDIVEEKETCGFERQAEERPGRNRVGPHTHSTLLYGSNLRLQSRRETTIFQMQSARYFLCT